MVGGAHHDGFSDFVANEHIDHTSVTLTAGTGLTGGGDISSNRTFAVDGLLEDLDTLGANSADSEFLVGTGAGALAWESGATARTSLGLGSVENTALSTWAGTTNITTLGTITTVGNITIADGGTIGQVSGPLLTFNDTTNTFAITQCTVCVGSSTSKSKLTVEGSITLEEKASAGGDTANYGQIWVEDTIPCRLMFTNDVGVDYIVDVTAV